MSIDPASLTIVLYPAPVLRRKATEVPAVDNHVREVAARMIELMDEAEGIGLAAPQVGLPWRMFVCHVPADEDRSASADPPMATLEPATFINPVLRDPEGPNEGLSEGCLSLPDIAGDVQRPWGITIDALGLDGEPISMRAGGLLARCWQHEVDHLDGVLILDRMSHLSRLRSRSAVRSLERAAKIR